MDSDDEPATHWKAGYYGHGSSGQAVEAGHYEAYRAGQIARQSMDNIPTGASDPSSGPDMSGDSPSDKLARWLMAAFFIALILYVVTFKPKPEQTIQFLNNHSQENRN